MAAAMANTGPPRPKPLSATVDATDDYALTVPQAWSLYSGVIGFHVPRHLANAAKINAALAGVR